MTWRQTSFSRSLIALGFSLAMFCFVAPHAVSAQGRGNGNGKGNGGGGGNGDGGNTPTGWVDDLNSIDPARWVKAGPETPVPGNSSQNFGTYNPEHLTIVQDAATGNRYLQIKLTQVSSGGSSVVSTGGLLYSTEKYAYGTYEWTLRMSSNSATPLGGGNPESGNVSAAFIYTNNSQTEIDFEFSGHVIGDFDPLNDETLYMANWKNKGPKSPPSNNELTSSTTEVPGITSGFKTYRFIWEQGKITFCVNGLPEAVHSTNVPRNPANVMINHWGTNNPNGFGGAATIGTRYFYVDRVGYTPSLLGCNAPFVP
jgi:beta-glucanase (GH16 family)